MRRSMGLWAAILMVIAMVHGSPVMAETTPPPANPPPAAPATAPKCNLNEFPATENGMTVCKKVPACVKGEIISYDTATQKFACKKLVECDPKTQQAAYINGKNVCIDVPNCERQGKHYAFDGTKMVCE